jgi:short-subunit dehydrogenase
MRRYVFAGGTAGGTGAASGICEALAHALARRGSHLVLLDRDTERLSGVAAAIRDANPGLRVETHVVDLADRDTTTDIAHAGLRGHPRIQLLVNNVGVALGGRFDQATLQEFEGRIRLAPGQCLQPVRAHRPAGQAADAARKFAVRGFTEALRQELAANGICVTSVHPGGVRPRIAESARVGSGVSRREEEDNRAEFATLLAIDPTHAANVIIEGIERRRGRVLIGWLAKIPDLLARLLPAAYGKVLTVALRARRRTSAGAADRRTQPATWARQRA